MLAVAVSTGTTAMKWIIIWGGVALAAAILGGIFASQKNRDASSWAAWCFLFPPLVIFVMLMRKNTGPKPARKPLDDLDHHGGGAVL